MLGMMYTAQQNTYVESPLEGHKKVIAVPGSGKSTGLLGRISYLIDNGVNPRTIVALMFSTSAKKSFEKKLKSSSASMGKVSTYTFNGIGLRLLKRFASHGIIPELKILGESAQNIAFRNLCRSALAHVGLPKFDGKLFEELVAASKSDIIPVKDNRKIQNLIQEFPDDEQAKLISAINHYDVLRRSKNHVFFDDMVYDTVQLLQNNPKARALISKNLAYLIIDEYQDVNPICQQLLQHLANEKTHLTVVGDDDQSIFAFRNSDPSFLLTKFDEAFPNPDIYYFSKTFRYGHAIALASTMLIEENGNRTDKLCVSSPTAEQSKVELWFSKTDVCTWDKDPIIDAGQRYLADDGHQSMAILLRVFAGAHDIELLLIDQKIPYELVGSGSFLKSPLVKMILAFSELLSLGLGAPSIDVLLYKILSFAVPASYGSAIEDLIEKRDDDWSAFSFQASNATGIKSDALRKQLTLRIDAIHDGFKSTLPLFEVLQRYIDGCDFVDLAERNRGIWRNIQASTLVRIKEIVQRHNIGTHEELTALLSPAAAKENGKSIIITTMHRSKGLEYDHVVLPNLLSRTLPLFDEHHGLADIDEDRRLFYVAMTRARKRLSLITVPDKDLERLYQGEPYEKPGFDAEDRASPFLFEINLPLAIKLGHALDNNFPLDEVLKMCEESSIATRYINQIKLEQEEA